MKQCFLTIKVNGEESWIYAYDLETTDQSSEYRLKETSPKSFENQGDDYRGVVHYEFLSTGQTVREFYLSVMRYLREAIRKKKLEL